MSSLTESKADPHSFDREPGRRATIPALANVTPQQRAAVLAGLRLLQSDLDDGRSLDLDVYAVYTDGGTHEGIPAADIDALCDALNYDPAPVVYPRALSLWTAHVYPAGHGRFSYVVSRCVRGGHMEFLADAQGNTRRFTTTTAAMAAAAKANAT